MSFLSNFHILAETLLGPADLLESNDITFTICFVNVELKKNETLGLLFR